MKTLRKPTQLRQVAIAQLRFLYKEKYLAGLMGVLLLEILVTRIMIAPLIERVGLPPWEMQPLVAYGMTAVIFVGIIAAFLTWYNEPPSRRRYHRSMPVNQRLHVLMRLLAGVTWLIIALLGFGILAALAEDRVLREHWLMHAPTIWLAIFALPLLAYLLSSIFVVAFDREMVWIFCVAAVALVMDSGPMAALVPEARDTARAIVWDADAPYSLAHVLAGAQRSAPWMGKEATERVLEATADDYIQAHPEFQRPMQTREQRAESLQHLRNMFRTGLKETVLPSPVPWLKALAVWFTIALCGLTLAVMRKPAG
jgi:hypothetical protein